MVSENKGDGRILKINWDKRFEPFDLEGFGGYRNTIQKVAEEDIDAIFKSTYRMSYYQELMNFISLAHKQETGKGVVGVSDFNNKRLKKFSNLSIEVSFGIGRASNVPWIAFLSENDYVQNGIYPVYLYYKENDLLILAYGVSEKNIPKNKWGLLKGKLIQDYFSENNLGNPEKYGNSYVFKTYNTKEPLIDINIDKDLQKIISTYNNIQRNLSVPQKKFHSSEFDTAIGYAGLHVAYKIQTRFISSLLTKPFVILTGLSGSGKTKLAQAFAMWICEDDSQYCIVPVGADWTNREPLLGFPNALKAKEYVNPITEFLI
jgi:5-methylcytosine-specific restriction protein B